MTLLCVSRPSNQHPVSLILHSITFRRLAFKGPSAVFILACQLSSSVLHPTYTIFLSISSRLPRSLAANPQPVLDRGEDLSKSKPYKLTLQCNNLAVFLSEATERRAAALDRQTSPSQQATALLTLEGMASYRRIQEAFHCKLKGPVVVDKKTLVELQNFQTPPAKGAFLRGKGMDQSTGRFTAQITGIYQFSANVHIGETQ
ncbi:hypothetical protein AMECASPLE_015980 [Ameca splendens]|uniref:C1q domain-containing protein n=1 Tax=Ameca splendens TaxID=208324 RepID=A0ABV1AA36_9TELE